MPPCGYRPTAVDGIKSFLTDNLRYFIELYRGRGLSIEQALAKENREIADIRGGRRGGEWSAAIVEINQLFYDRLADRSPATWQEVEEKGLNIIANAEVELNSLLLENV